MRRDPRSGGGVVLIAAVNVLAWTSVIAIGRWQGLAELLVVISLYVPTAAALAWRSARESAKSAWAAASRLLEMHRLMGAWSDGTFVV